MLNLIRQDNAKDDNDDATLLKILFSYCGVGLWDAKLHNGDPMHEKSEWTWSGEFRRLLGFDRNDTRNFPNVVNSWSDRLHTEDKQPTFDAFMACINDKTGKTDYDVEYRVKMYNGEYRWFRAVGGVSRDKNGFPLRACGALIDIHEQKNIKQRYEVLSHYAGVGLWDAVLHNGDPMHEKSQ